MNGMPDHVVANVLTYDGILHWCFLLSIVCLVVGATWVTFRILMPLRKLARQIEHIDQVLPSMFDEPVSGIREIETLRDALRDMSRRIHHSREREASYRNALVEIQEQERLRIARDLHDDTIQSLVVVTHVIERAAHAQSLDAETMKSRLREARIQIVGIIDQLRALVGNLRSTILDDLGLVSALESLCEEDARLEFRVVGAVYKIDHALELAILRVAQETIRNAARHARARQIVATLAYEPSGVTFSLSDDGIGFVPPHQLQEFASRGHFGLLGMHERICQLGGKLDVSSMTGLGTRVTVSFPSAHPQLHVPITLVAETKS
jgi:two-component system sensor histidine kinase UhpB